ncbi:MAG: hypothetical protein HRU72_12080 [Planctomycetia bacterium]|nr:MAG: hypothetical protein HRU72_12080 [Planctomycetia bacterium]
MSVVRIRQVPKISGGGKRITPISIASKKAPVAIPRSRAPNTMPRQSPLP